MSYIKNPIYKYSLNSDALTVTFEYDKNNPRTDAKKFNRGVRYYDTMLITGDLPGIAMVTSHPEDVIHPEFILKLGDLKVKITDNDSVTYFHEADKIKTEFNPVSTEWQLQFERYPSVTFILKATLLNSCGILCMLDVLSESGFLPDIEIQISYGCFRTGEYPGTGENARTEYFDIDKNIADTLVEQKDDGAFIIKSNQDISKCVEGTATQYIDETVMAKYFGNYDSIRSEDSECICSFSLNNCRHIGFCAVHSPSPDELYNMLFIKDLAEAEIYFKESDNRCLDILQSNDYKTDCPILDAGFKHAVLNLDYIHTENAWYEGGHYWRCYFPNNYQIGAAVALGQYDYAKKALLFFGNQPEGYSTLTSSGKPAYYAHYSHIDRQLSGFEGVPYYIYQLWLYTEATGDLSVVQEVADNIYTMICDMFCAHDINNINLLGWRYESNPFIYQSDHLGMPGFATSPSVMMSGMLELFSDMVMRTGKLEMSTALKLKAKSMLQKIPDMLFEKKYGFFSNHVDFQGFRHNTHYYTDYVFPILYSSLNEEYSWQSIENLLHSICFKSETTEKLLMRVGEFEPYMFGTCNVMPTQMAETARAMFKSGYINEAMELMESVALAATIYTKSPGSFPEQMSDNGDGQANYIFGNPAGSYAYTYIAGIFGLSLANGGEKLIFSPIFHDLYNHASVSTSYADIRFEGKKYYIKIKSDKIKTLEFELTTKPIKNASVTVNSKQYIPTLKKIPNNTRFNITHEITDKEFVIIPELQYAKIQELTDYELTENQKLSASFDGFEVYDPQNLTCGTAALGIRNLFLISNEANTVIPVSAVVRKKVYTPELKLNINNGSASLTIDGNAPVAKNRTVTVKCICYLKNGEKSIFFYDIPVDNNGKYSKTTDIQLFSKKVGKVILCNYTIFDNDMKIADGMTNINVLFDNSQDIAKAIPFGLEEYLNNSEMMVRSAWRTGRNYQVKLPESDSDEYCNGFKIIRTENGSVKLCVIGPGFSFKESRLLEPSGNKNVQIFSVNKNISCLEFFYATEAETRLLGSTVGNILLQYRDGTAQNIPLTVGKNFSSLFGNVGDDVEKVKCPNGDDYVNILRIGTYPEKHLCNFAIEVFMHDAELALIAANYYE